MATVTLDKAQRWYPGTDEPAVSGIDLEINDGEFMVHVHVFDTDTGERLSD